MNLDRSPLMRRGAVPALAGFMAALFALAAAGMSAGDAQALALYSTDLNTNELVKIDSDNGMVTALGPVGIDLGDTDLTASGCLIYVLSSNPGNTRILTFDAVNGAPISSMAVTFNGNTVSNAEGLAEVSGQLVIAFDSGSTSASHILGNLSPTTGVISGPVVDYSIYDPAADADGMCARPDGSFIWTDRVTSITTNLRNVEWPTPSGPTTFFSYGTDRPVHDIVLAGSDLFGLDDAGRILIRQDPTTGLILLEIPLQTTNLLGGLAYPDCGATDVKRTTWGSLKSLYR